jgi:phosphoribosyl 1,2-cyclic phosphodiesterase
MAQLKVVSSGSVGNSYILRTNSGTLLIEAGVPYNTILKSLDFVISDVQGAIVTHCHGDHLNKGTIKNFARNGMKIYGTKECSEKAADITALTNKQSVQIGTFKVLPLKVPHNAECFSYVIMHPEIGTLLFATDLCEFPYKVKNLNHLLIECNYSQEIVEEAVYNGVEIRSQSENHLELNDCIDTINRLKSNILNKVVLLHLSSNLSDCRLFKTRILEDCGIKCEVATPELVVNLDKEEF